VDIKKTRAEFTELKQKYDRARTSYEIAVKELGEIEKELKKRGLTVASLSSVIDIMGAVLVKKEARLEKLMEKIRGTVAKIKTSKG